MKEFPQAPFRTPTKAANWLLSFGIIGVCVTTSYLIGEGRGWAAGLAIGVVALLIQVSWPLKRELWFWLTVASVAAVHAWGLIYFDWSWVSERNGLKLLATFIIPDLAAMMVIIYGLYRLKYGAPVEAIEPNIDDLPRYNNRDIDL